MTDEQEIQWVLVHSSSDEQEVNLLKSILEENEIESVIMNKRDSTYLFGDVELYVSTSDAFNAVQLIKKFLE